MFKKALFMVAAISALSACQPLAEIKSEPANAVLTNTAAQGRLAKGTSFVTVRAFAVDAAGKKGGEVIGASCDLRSDDLSARAITPQKVIVPTFKQRAEFEDRGVPSALVVTCTDGTRIGKSQVTAAAKSSGTATGAGLAGALITLAVTSAIAASTPWVYEGEIHVLMSDK